MVDCRPDGSCAICRDTDGVWGDQEYPASGQYGRDPERQFFDAYAFEQWNDADGRQVWLEGEAYFQVQKKPSTVEKFIVHTRQVDVEVLGTRFNVNTRRQRAVVSLEEGKVRLSVHGGDAAVLEKKSAMIMRPGQVVVIGVDRKASINSDKDVATRSGLDQTCLPFRQHLAWRDRRDGGRYLWL